MRRGIAVVVAAMMMVLGAAPGLANERSTDERPTVHEVDRPTERPSAAGPSDPPVKDVVDRRVDVDRPVDREIDRPVDREIDRYRCVDFVTDRRCIDDRHPHVNIRHLIQRLINAGEWEKLFRLLHRLGII